MAMKLEYVKVANYKKDFSCPHNSGVRCDEKMCYNCGWNPTVAKLRLEKIRQKLAEVGNG